MLPERSRIMPGLQFLFIFFFFWGFTSPFSCFLWHHCCYLCSACLFNQGVRVFVCTCHVHLYPCLCLHMASCLTVCVIQLHLLHLPLMYCNTLSFPPYFSASLCGLGVWSRSLQEALLLVLKWKQTVMHKHRKCCFPHTGSGWASVTVIRKRYCKHAFNCMCLLVSSILLSQLLKERRE